MPPARFSAGQWITWDQLILAYDAGRSSLQNPSNPVPEPGGAPAFNGPFRVRSSYALNSRFYGVFSTGPFPLDNLELPAETAMFVEAGPAWKTPYSPGGSLAGRPAALTYSDTEDRLSGLSPYPSTHLRRLAVVAVDGHAAAIHVAHYGPEDALHDRRYGRIGDDIFDWNGGHPNGQTGTPVRE